MVSLDRIVFNHNQQCAKSVQWMQQTGYLNIVSSKGKSTGIAQIDVTQFVLVSYSDQKSLYINDATVSTSSSLKILQLVNSNASGFFSSVRGSSLLVIN